MKTWVDKVRDSSQDKRIEFEREYTAIEVAHELYYALQSLGMSKADFARKINKSKGYITRLFQGDYNLTVGTLAELAYHLGGRVEVRFEPVRALDRKQVIPINVDTRSNVASWKQEDLPEGGDVIELAG